MSLLPDRPKIYHITHVNNLPSIIGDGGLFSDEVMVQDGGPATSIGMSKIKWRRLTELSVTCHPGDFVGQYVPFYFCPRSVMLIILYYGNNPELTYREGQDLIVHLEADLYDVVEWAEANTRRWAFSLSNAGARYTQFRKDLDRLDEIDWTAVAARYFQDRDVKESKQAEFLLRDFCPWELVTRIGVYSRGVYAQATEHVAEATHRPKVTIQRDWYFP